MYSDNEIFNREPIETMYDQFPTTIVICGCGGIGSNLAHIVSTIQRVKHLILFDPDIIEVSNLNRTIYSSGHVGTYKVIALKEYLNARRHNLLVRAAISNFDSKFVEDFENMLNGTYQGKFVGDCKDVTCFNNLRKGSISNEIAFIDCRDDYYGDHNDVFRFLNSMTGTIKDLIGHYFRAAYDGMSITVDPMPQNHPVWSLDNHGRGYRHNTSNGIASMACALLTVNMIALMTKERRSLEDTPSEGPSMAKFEDHLTFNVEAMYPALYTLIRLLKKEKGSSDGKAQS